MNIIVKELKFSNLPYSYDALEPYIDKMTMEIHHSKHHKAYFDNLMKAVKGTEMSEMAFEDLIKNISKYPVAVRNNGGGFYNHNLFWAIMSTKGSGAPSGSLMDAMNDSFGSFDAFKNEFSNAAKTRFGSGWAWMCSHKGGKLSICSTPNQDNPLMDVGGCGGNPVLGLDVWEHAYYLKYQNRRPDYIEAFYKIINWDEVQKRYDAVK
ncbi:superoxide dismutase [Bacteroidota bacterium]